MNSILFISYIIGVCVLIYSYEKYIAELKSLIAALMEDKLPKNKKGSRLVIDKIKVTKIK